MNLLPTVCGRYFGTATGLVYILLSMIFISIPRFAMTSLKENAGKNSSNLPLKSELRLSARRLPWFMRKPQPDSIQPEQKSDSVSTYQESVCHDLLPESPTSVLNRSSNEDLWYNLHSMAERWVGLYHSHSQHHKILRDVLIREKLVDTRVGSDEISVCDTPFPIWRRGQTKLDSDAAVNTHLLSLLDILESETSHLGLKGIVQHKESQSVQTDAEAIIDPQSVQARVNGISVNLRFKNSGNNDINDIETYLQEKLDVLEFIQMDCNKMEISQLAPSRVAAPRLLETSVLNHSTHSGTASAPFFIGTPTAEDLGINLPILEESQDGSDSDHNDPLDESQLHWETSSVLSGRSHSRRRSLSNASFSSNSSSRKPTAGMFARGRMARLVNNTSFSRDENSEDSFTPTTWW